MLFNSIEYLLFLPVVFFLYWLVFNRSLRQQNLLLLVASYFFYGWWSYSFLGLLALSTLLDFIYGFQVASPNRKKARIFLWLSIVNNLGILGTFKYYNFFAGQFKAVLGVLGLQADPIVLNVALPVGISFYTFHGMSYVFDIYKGKQKPVSDPVEYAVFVAFFPLLVAGPIERAHHLLPQVRSRRIFDYRQAAQGGRLILWGMFKKVVVADSLAKTVDTMFSHYQHFNAFALIVGAISFSFQIYGDFSGYSDIAIGSAKLLGFELLSNFKFPYFSRDIAEFWRRWHISLTSWFRDYLYIPLGGSRQGNARAVRNTMIIFLVSGFWHGASWTFLAWGLVHALAFLPLLLWSRNRQNVDNMVAQERRLPTLSEMWKMASTFAFVTIAWIFFRADKISDALGYIGHMGKSIAASPGQFLTLPAGKSSLAYILPLVLGDWWLRKDERNLTIVSQPLIRRFVFWVAIIAIATKYNANRSFIYFQF
ncbi:MAG: MBOAT family protein [Bacteroidetes bacterium]|nr:MBOAT family protein [Bacteroidota bacterium]